MGTIPIHGAKELFAALAALPAKMQANILRQALHKAGEPVLAEVRSRAPAVEGAYRRSLVLKRPRIIRKNGEVAGGIGTDKDELYTITKGRRPSNIAALLEFGHAYVAKVGNRTWTGTVAAQPHMRPGLEAATGPVLRIVTDYIRKRLARLARAKKR